METYQYVLIAVAVIIVIGVAILVLKKPKQKTKGYELPEIINLLDKSNIEKIDYIRNKIVINFKDVTKFDTEQLQTSGALGIAIVGDKVKFYFDGGNEVNQQIFEELSKYIER